MVSPGQATMLKAKQRNRTKKRKERRRNRGRLSRQWKGKRKGKDKRKESQDLIKLVVNLSDRDYFSPIYFSKMFKLVVNGTFVQKSCKSSDKITREDLLKFLLEMVEDSYYLTYENINLLKKYVEKNNKIKSEDKINKILKNTIHKYENLNTKQDEDQ